MNDSSDCSKPTCGPTCGPPSSQHAYGVPDSCGLTLGPPDGPKPALLGFFAYETVDYVDPDSIHQVLPHVDLDLKLDAPATPPVVVFEPGSDPATMREAFVSGFITTPLGDPPSGPSEHPEEHPAEPPAVQELLLTGTVAFPTLASVLSGSESATDTPCAGYLVRRLAEAIHSTDSEVERLRHIGQLLLLLCDQLPHEAAEGDLYSSLEAIVRRYSDSSKDGPDVLAAVAGVFSNNLLISGRGTQLQLLQGVVGDLWKGWEGNTAATDMTRCYLDLWHRLRFTASNPLQG